MSASAPHAALTGWTRIEHDALRGGGHVVYLNDILPADGSENPWLTVGYVVDSDGNRDPSAWTSADGVTWRRFTMESTGSSEQRDGVFFVARRGNVAVAVGNRFDGRIRTAAWSSTSPDAWSALKAASDPLLAFEGSIEALDAAADAFIAVGVRHTTTNSVVMVFRSEDGRAWSVDSTFATPAGEGFQPLAASATSERIVIVGDTATGSGADGRIWVGSNGSWSSVAPAPIGLDGAGLQQVAGIARDEALGFVAGGMTTRLGVEIPTLWSSPDGLVWTRLPEGSPPLGGGSAAIHRIVAVPGGFLASGDSDTGPRLWRSSNGRDWAAIPTPSSPSSGGRLVNVASDAAKIVLVVRGQAGSQLFYRLGSDWRRGDTGSAFPASTPVAAELRDIAVAKGRVIAVGNDGRERPLVMISQRASVWRKSSFADRAARFLAITSERGVFSISGWRLVRGRAHLAVWTSRTGANWRLLGGGAHDPIGAFVDIAPGPSGLLAAAFEGSQRGLKTSVWTGTRGIWRSAAVLGSGEARAICAGPHGATAVATVGIGPRSRVLAWTRASNGWSPEPEVVAAPASASRCADGPLGTVIVGSDENGSAVAWRRTGQGMSWKASILASTAPPTMILDVVRDGSGYLASGSAGDRGQVDLAVWRSPDGVQWTRIGGIDPAFLEPGFQAGLAIVRARGRIIVVGRHGAGNAGLWEGAP